MTNIIKLGEWFGGGQAKMDLQTLLAAHPRTVERESLDEQTGYRRSSRDAYLHRLRAKQLIEQPARGMVRASQELFA